jgi:hypothetical protein
MPHIERPGDAARRLGIGLTKFYEDFIDHGDGDVIPGTDIPRLRAVPLGAVSTGFFSDEVDRLIEALRRWRDAAPRRAEPAHLRAGRDRYWRQRKRAKTGKHQ